MRVGIDKFDHSLLGEINLSLYMKPKEFIQKTLIDGMKDIVFRHPYLSFALISLGIEFIGKCMLTDYQEWDFPKDKAYEAFDTGNKMLSEVDPRYKDVGLKEQLRNGLIHTLSPKSKISLSEVKAGDKHFGIDTKGKTILVAEILYRDFVIMCERVISQKFSSDDKMNKEFLDIYK